MKTLRHLLMTDLRRFGWLMAAWVALVAAGAVVYAWQPIVAASGPMSEGLRMLGGALWIARQVYRLVLIAMIVHAHPTIGTTAFWMTRPIPPRVLAASKALLIGLVFVGAPVAADVALALKYSMPPGAAALSALQTAIVNGVWVALCLMVAVLTRTLAQFALVCGVATSTLLLVPFVIQPMLFRGAGAGATVRAYRAFSPALAAIAVLACTAFLVAAAFVQYSRRRRPESFAVGAGGACVALALALAPPPSFLLAKPDAPQWARDARLQVAPMSPTPWVSMENNGKTSWATVRATLALPALPAGWFAFATLRNATVQTADGSLESGTREFQPSGTVSRSAEGNEHPVRVALREVLGVDRVVDSYYGVDSSELFSAPAAEAERLGSLRGRYRGRFLLNPAHLDAVGVLPLAVGATAQDGAYRVTIRDVRLDGLLTIRMQMSDITRLLPGGARVDYVCYLRNRVTAEAVVGNRRLAHDVWIVPGAPVLADAASITPGVSTSAQYLTYRGSPSLSAPGWELTEEWVRNAELVLVRTTYFRSIEVPLEIDTLTVVPSRAFRVPDRRRP